MKSIVCMCLLVPCLALAAEQQVSESQQPFVKRYVNQSQIVPPEEALLNRDPEPDLSQGFVALFNGNDLTGWVPRGGECTFAVEDGCIVGTTIKGSPSTYLCTTRDDYQDFIFSAEVKWIVEGNSGIMIRSQQKPGKKWATVFGPQVEMEPPSQQRDWSGGIFGQGIGGWQYPLWLEAHQDARKALKKDVWNRITIYACGTTVKTWLNGVPAAHWTSDRFLKGLFGLQVHSGNEGRILFRNIRVKELSAAVCPNKAP